jgi:hypothetical protein
VKKEGASSKTLVYLGSTLTFRHTVSSVSRAVRKDNNLQKFSHWRFLVGLNCSTHVGVGLQSGKFWAFLPLTFFDGCEDYCVFGIGSLVK